MSIALNELRVQNSIASGEKLIVAGTTAEVQIDYDVLAKAIVEQWSGSTLAGSSQSVKSAIDAAQTTSETLNTNIAELRTRISQMSGGVPPTASSTSGMNPEVSPIYVNTTDGKWYYWDGSAWTSGGTYGGAVTDGGLTADIKSALLACFANVAWAGNDGQDYYDALDAALNPPAGLVSISAVYTQSGTVYDTASLDSLKPDLVVTAHYDNFTTQTITNYTLSGTLTEGTSTITVSYGGKTATFNVIVSVFNTAPVIAEEGKVWSSTSTSSAPVLYNAAGFGVTETYGCTFSQSNLESSGLYDATNDYMTTNGWSGIKYYISDVNTIADGKSWPSSNRSKHTMIKNDAAIVGWNSVTKNAEATWQFLRYISNAAHCDGVSFTIPLLDKDDCYAYWHKPVNNSILPDGISEGDVIFAGRNTPYWGCSNISEASS